MCVACSTADELDLIRGARQVADAILDRHRHSPVRKAMDLGTKEGFDRAVAGMAAELRRAVAATDDGAVRAAVAVLDVDWRQTTAAQRRRLVAQALEAAGDFNVLDRRITRHLVRTQANFVRDEYARRLDTLGEQARRVVADRFEAGLGREEIAADLQRAA